MAETLIHGPIRPPVEQVDARIVRTNLRVIDAKLRARIDNEPDNARAGKLRRALVKFEDAAKDVLEALA